MTQILYDKDFDLWLGQTIQQLKSRDFDALDIEHLIEELANLGEFKKRYLEGNLVVLLTHLLRLTVQSTVPDTMKGNWSASVKEHRQRVEVSLQAISSPKSALNTLIPSAYREAKKLAIRDGQNAILGVRIPKNSEYPETCPFSVEQILDEDFYGLENF